MSKASHKYGSLVERVTRIFFNMDQATVDRVLQTYRTKYGDGAYAYAKRTMAAWRQGEVRQVGQTVMRLLEVVPMYVDHDTKFELVRIMREETLRRLRQYRITITLGSQEPLTVVMDRLREVIEMQLSIELPPGYFEVENWLSEKDGIAFQRMIREGERRVLQGQAADFFLRLRFLQHIQEKTVAPTRIVAVFELPTAQINVRIVQAKRKFMSNEENPGSQDDERLLSKWSDFELETRFKAGEVSYPEYVLRNMDQFFSPEEQSELHKIAAMHGLELERLLMEIQIKSRTSEADLQKLLNTLRTLQEKGITADVVSRHETPSGHIEISARSNKKWGCFPALWVIGLLVLVLVLVF